MIIAVYYIMENSQVEILSNKMSRAIFKLDDELVQTLSQQKCTLTIKLQNNAKMDVNLVDSQITKFFICVNGAQYTYMKDDGLYGEISFCDLQRINNDFVFKFDVINKDNNKFIVLWREMHNEKFVLQIPDQISTILIGFKSHPTRMINVETFIFSIS